MSAADKPPEQIMDRGYAFTRRQKALIAFWCAT
jgi:hypothetical protein